MPSTPRSRPVRARRLRGIELLRLAILLVFVTLAVFVGLPALVALAAAPFH